MPKSKPKMEARVKTLRDQIILAIEVSEHECTWGHVFDHKVEETQDGFVVTDLNKRKY